MKGIIKLDMELELEEEEEAGGRTCRTTQMPPGNRCCCCKKAKQERTLQSKVTTGRYLVLTVLPTKYIAHL